MRAASNQEKCWQTEQFGIVSRELKLYEDALSKKMYALLAQRGCSVLCTWDGKLAQKLHPYKVKHMTTTGASYVMNKSLLKQKPISS